MLYSDHVKTGGGFLEIPSGVEFVVAVASDGLVSEKGFTAHVQEAYNRDIPLIAKLDVNIDIYGKDFSMANPLWPSFANDPHMKILKPFFDVCRIHAVMLDIRNSVGSEVWIPFVTKHLRELILNNFSVPVYILGDNELTTKYPAGAMDAFLSIEKMFCTYFPTTYNDFTEASPGMMFMEMAAYVGDVLSFYLDNQVQENYLQFARQSNNLFELAYMFGYKPNVTGVALTNVDFYQKVPSKLSGSVYIPDFDYTLFVNGNATVTTTDGISFLIADPVDFSVSSSNDPTETSIYEVSGGNPTYYLLKKTRKAISSTINTKTFSSESDVVPAPN